MRPASRAAGLTSAVAGKVLLVSLLWCTIALAAWVITIVVIGGGFGAVNFIVIGLIFWGPILGAIAAGAHILASFVIGRVLAQLPRDLAAALLGWGCALAVWGSLTFGGTDVNTIVGSAIVALVGAVLTFAVVRGHHPALLEHSSS